MSNIFPDFCIRFQDAKHNLHLGHLNQPSWFWLSVELSSQSQSGATIPRNWVQAALSNIMTHTITVTRCKNKNKSGLLFACSLYILTAWAFYFLVNWWLFHTDHEATAPPLSHCRGRRGGISPLPPPFASSTVYFHRLVKHITMLNHNHRVSYVLNSLSKHIGYLIVQKVCCRISNQRDEISYHKLQCCSLFTCAKVCVRGVPPTDIILYHMRWCNTKALQLWQKCAILVVGWDTSKCYYCTRPVIQVL